MRGCGFDERFQRPTNDILHPTKCALPFHGDCGRITLMVFIIVTLLLGMGNFAWHRAVLESGHRMVSDMPPESRRTFRLFSLALEFLLLCGALYAVRLGHTHWLWAYLGYSAINAGAAWLILKRKI